MTMTDILALNGWKKTGLYILYWLAYLGFFTFIQGAPSHGYHTAFLTELISLPLKAGFVAIVMEWMMRKYLFEKRAVVFVAYYLPLLLFFAFLQRLADNYINLPYFLHWERQALFEPGPYVYNILKFQFVAAVPFSVKLFAYWARERNKTYLIEGEKMQAELNFLRNQFHPHFLFNVMNSLYEKILTNAGDAADVVLKISSLLRFSLYDISKTISLEEEFRYLKDYIALQQVRFHQRVDLSLTITGPQENKYMEPFLLIPFVENSFKYCMDEESGLGWITLFISVRDEWLTMKIENSIHAANPAHAQETAALNHEGIGLTNVKRRLQLLYPASHTLKITDSGDSFFVSLKLKLYDGKQ